MAAGAAASECGWGSEMVSDNQEGQPGTQSDIRAGLKAASPAVRMFLWGLGFSAIFGEILLTKRMPHSPWAIVLAISFLVLMVSSLFRKDEASGMSQLLWFATCLCLAAPYYMRTHDWAPVATGALLAVYLWAHFKLTGRSYPFVSACALVAGFLSLQVPWPNSQRCLLTLVGVGVTVSLQGAWLMVRNLQGHQPAQSLQPAEAPNESADRVFLHVLHWTFGAIEHVQICSPELEQRIQRRYQSEIGQLRNLGFDFLFSDGETFSLFRLALLLPVIAVLEPVYDLWT
jgi:hypothetical protein